MNATSTHARRAPETTERDPLLTMSASPVPSATPSIRDEIDALYASYLQLARTSADLAKALDRGDSSAAGGRVRAAVGHIWRAAEDLHTAFHTAPPRGTEPPTPLARLCGRRMRYLATRAARGAK
ncbi:DUF6238 family protein [Streptomyces jumonjinensis]|uniref:Uncharacterized protein n=1 Tax=Streptomyces jumonjinensis TaxID=1945 RepID=A0A646KRW3_STRJU|nr:DUF6238 family protein [Streptomyces jumonjinensis]MQT05074.1 hypothetical protein [Streptomyces jumonjinensis]